MKRVLKWLIGLYLASVALALVLQFAVLPRMDVGIAITVENHSGRKVFDVIVKYRGGEVPIGDMAPGDVGHGVIRAQGDSSVAVPVRGPGSGPARDTDLDVYIGVGYSGQLVVRIGPRGEVTRTREILRSASEGYMAVRGLIVLPLLPVMVPEFLFWDLLGKLHASGR